MVQNKHCSEKDVVVRELDDLNKFDGCRMWLVNLIQVLQDKVYVKFANLIMEHLVFRLLW